MQSTTQGLHREGDRVECKWEDGKWYTAKVVDSTDLSPGYDYVVQFESDNSFFDAKAEWLRSVNTVPATVDAERSTNPMLKRLGDCLASGLQDPAPSVIYLGKRRRTNVPVKVELKDEFEDDALTDDGVKEEVEEDALTDGGSPVKNTLAGAVAPDKPAPRITLEFDDKWGEAMRIKIEEFTMANLKGFVSNPSRVEERAKYLLEPSSGKPRKVFRRGCHCSCITTVLGGIGCRPAPRVKKDREFIKKGEFYIAGREDWNPYDPVYAGDKGVINSVFFLESSQPYFHLFRQCSTVHHKSGYYGKQAAGGYLYLGVYEVDPEDLPQGISFRDLPRETRHIHAYQDVVKHGKRCSADKFALAAAIQPEEWPKLEHQEKCIEAMLVELESNNNAVWYTPVRFVRYDEGLYSELVRIGAVAKNGKAIIDLDDLGPLY